MEAMKILDDLLPDPAEQLADALKQEGAGLLLTLKESARHARCEYTTLWRAVSDGSLAAHKRGRRWLVPRLELARWIVGPPH